MLMKRVKSVCLKSRGGLVFKHYNPIGDVVELNNGYGIYTKKLRTFFPTRLSYLELNGIKDEEAKKARKEWVEEMFTWRKNHTFYGESITKQEENNLETSKDRINEEFSVKYEVKFEHYLIYKEKGNYDSNKELLGLLEKTVQENEVKQECLELLLNQEEVLKSV